MAKGNKSGAIIILAIISLGALGLSGYVFINDQFFGGNEQQGNELIAVWESITGSTGNLFYVNFSDNQLDQSDYFTSTPGITNITLVQKGWYRFTIHLVLGDLLSTDTYALSLWKNGALHEYLDYQHFPQEVYRTISTVAYVYSDGTDYFQFRCEAFGLDNFYILGTQTNNKATLEFLE